LGLLNSVMVVSRMFNAMHNHQQI